MFITAIPGLGELARDELVTTLPGIVDSRMGFDGRADIVSFYASREARRALSTLRLADDVFVEVGRANTRGAKPEVVAAQLWQRDSVQRGLSAWGEQVRPLRAAMSLRVITRVRQELSFQRTDLRRALYRAIERDRPRWTHNDPANIELWALEYQPNEVIAGFRLSDKSMRQHGERARERPGALRPTVAAALVHLAGTPNGVLFDPCCGSGTILSEAQLAGWAIHGADISPEAVTVASANVPQATLMQAMYARQDYPTLRWPPALPTCRSARSTG